MQVIEHNEAQHISILMDAGEIRTAFGKDGIFRRLQESCGQLSSNVTAMIILEGNPELRGGIIQIRNNLLKPLEEVANGSALDETLIDLISPILRR